VWPTNSPDLNPIQKLWKILKDIVQNKYKPKNREEIVEMEWRAIPRQKA